MLETNGIFYDAPHFYLTCDINTKWRPHDLYVAAHGVQWAPHINVDAQRT